MRNAATPPTAPAAPHVQPRRGMAMVLVLILIVVMSLAAVAGFARSGSELATTSNLRAEADAWSVAYEGLERYLINQTTTPATLPHTVTYSMANGTAIVTLAQVRSGGATGVQTFIVRSVGRVTNRRTSTTTPVATRTLTQMVKRQTSSLDVDAAFVALNGLNKNGTSGGVSGHDECAALGSIPGLAVPTGGYVPGSNSPNANNYIDGIPDNMPAELGPSTPGNAPGTANAAVRVDWKGVLDGDALQPDFAINRRVTPNTGTFPSSYANWPVVRVTGDVTNGDNFSGRGILVVTGNANLTNVQWDGIVLIGGEVSVSGAATRVKGALITGLNMKIVPLSDYPFLSQTYPQPSSVGNGNFLVRYNSCNVASALNRYGGWLRVANTWSDNWPSP